MTDSLPVISAIIPTVGRASLRKALESVLSQEIAEGWVEVIVVNDSGSALEPELDHLLPDPRVTVLSTNRRRQAVARNTGAAVARGQALLFLDDDDWLLPGALARLRRLLEEYPATVAAYGSSLVIGTIGGGGEQELGILNADVDGNCAAPMLAGAFIPTGSLLCNSDAFWHVSGYDPVLVSSQDIDLTRKLALYGDLASTRAAVSVYYRGSGWVTTSDYPRSVEDLRLSREKVLDKTGVFARLCDSADSPYWRARIVKAYAASVYWNLKRRRVLTALSRGLFCMLALAHAVPSLYQRQFWRGLVQRQVTGSLQAFLDKASRTVRPDA